MYIENIEIHNFRSIGVNPPLKLKISDITVLAGTNDTGKTSILGASYLSISSFLDVMSRNLEWQMKLANGSKHYIGLEEEKNKQVVRVGFKCANKEVSYILDTIIKDNSLNYQLQKLFVSGVDISLDKVREYIKEMVIFLELPLISTDFNSYDDSIDYDNWFKNSEEFFGYQNIRDFSLYLFEVITSLTLLEKSIKKIVCLFVPSITRSENISFKIEENKNLTNIVSFFREISSEKGRRKGDYSKFLSYCEILFPELERVEIGIPEGGDLSEDLFLTWKMNGNEKYQPLSRSGGGVYNTLYLLAKLINSYNDINIVLIDEPEIGLHPMLQQRFVKLLRKLSIDFPIKWILATHSPFILQNLKDGEGLYLIEHDGIQTNGREINITNKEEVFLSLGAYLPLTLSSKGVIFVEGQTEVTVLTILLNKIGFDLDKERLLIIPLGGENLFKIEPMNIKKLHDKSMVIIDSDLPKSEKDGGNIKKIKIEYGESCSKNKVEFVMIKEYRTLENMYPKDVLDNALNRESEVKYDSYDMVPGITEKNKIRIGENVANNMSVEQTKEFPLVKEIIDWWQK